MRKIVSFAASLLCLSAAAHTIGSETTRELAVQVSARTQSSPAQITLVWPQDASSKPDSYTIYRKAPGEKSWGTGMELPGASTVFVDNNVAIGTPYEYQIVKRTPNYTGYGYIYAGIEVPLTEDRGKLLLVVDNTCVNALAAELARLEQDLVGDGWMVERLEVDRRDSVTNVKKMIRARYAADPVNTKALFLFGHVPVAYSGDIVPDGHAPDHQGAWPCDGYYGDMDGVWTDATVNETCATDPRNRNVPGDGKFDQSVFPAPLKLMVGRVDLANMPGRLCSGGPATFPNETELLRNYLNKDHKFRTREMDVPRRGLVGDYFGFRDGEAFAASGWRNFASFFSATNITRLPDVGTWIPTLHSNAYLWAYGCGNGSYTSIEGLGNTAPYHDGITSEFMKGDLKAVFTLLFGSWLGDWDSEDNIQRSVLALPSYSLTCALSGRPHWFLHHMALGEPIGFGARLTQNNGPRGLYHNEVNNCAGQIHIALMGDPTLRMHPVAPPTHLRGTATASGVTLNWMPSDDFVVGYYVYGASNPNGPFKRLTMTPVTGTSYTDRSGASVAEYMVRAVKLEVSGSGSYYNPSQGTFFEPSKATVYSTLPAAKGTNTTATGRSAIDTGEEMAVRGDAQTDDRSSFDPREDALLTPTGNTTNIVSWVDDALPAGAIPGSDGGDSWNWVSSNPTPFSGTLANQSSVANGLHEHFFAWATQTLPVNTGDVLFAYVYLDPSNLPGEVMLQWFNGSWEHRAYWGVDNITYGVDGTAGRFYAGSLPAPGQWVPLQVPASSVGLEGSTLSGMAFTLYGGRATWDDAGKSSSAIINTNGSPITNTLPVNTNTLPLLGTNILASMNVIDYAALQPPAVGSNMVHVLTPNLLELVMINSTPSPAAQVTQWDLVSNNQFSPPPPGIFLVTANGQPIPVTGIGFKRRPLYAPFAEYDLRIENSLYLQLASPLATNQTVQVVNSDSTLWPANSPIVARVDPLRYSPAIHINQEGYMPNYAKQAMVGYYLGNLGEMSIPANAGFTLVDANTGAQVFQGSLVQRADVGFTYTPAPYQQVYMADFTSFNTPGQYRLVVPGLGASLPFSINSGVGMDFARAYALGLYHQRCGAALGLPYTRFQHGVCHDAPAMVPASVSTATAFTWTTVSNYAIGINANNPPQAAPLLTSPAAQLFPYRNAGPVDVSGGHHDAGDYSKYTINSASLIHYLMFAVDSLPGVAALDNLGIPESGDGISDVMQEAKWEADFLAKMQDADGGFYFLVYPQNREYEISVAPDHGDPQVVWPKNTSVTAASVAALAQCASSPLFKRTYPQAAALYLQKAQLGWQFLTNAIAKYGKNGAYQKITFYGDDWADNDELAWAACQMYLATGDASAHQDLLAWFDPNDPATWRWGWWHMSECWGHAIRSYAFAVQSGRVASASQLDATFLAKCQQQIGAAGDDVLSFSQQSAYGTSLAPQTKAVQSPGWYFSCDQAFDMAVAYQLNPNPAYLSATIANMNYEGGCNPLNVAYVAGLGWKRQRNFVSQWEVNTPRILPPSGLPVGNVQTAFSYLWNYQGELEALSYPSDSAATAPYPFYDRWGDSWNVSTEMVCLNSARALGALGFLAAQTGYATQPWVAPAAHINAPTTVVPVGSNITLSLQPPAGLDLSGARVVWEAQDQQPAFGSTFTYAPIHNGAQWVEVEAQLPDGRRVFATNTFLANSPNIVWVDDAVPAGAITGADGGDSWNWVSSNPTPYSGALAHQSAIAPGEHQHFFYNATATLSVSTGSVMYAYVYLDPANMPSEVMLQWNDGSSWEHRAYWGANSLTFGLDGTVSRHYVGALPAAGQWVQLQVPASAVGLEGSVVSGMAFTLYGGRATWDAAGCLNPMSISNVLPTITVAVAGTNASRVNSAPGVFAITRTGDVSNALAIVYSLGGTAVSGQDYQPPQPGVSPASVTIPAGAASTTLSVSPLPATNVVGGKTLSLSLTSSSAYVVGTPGAATLILGGNTVPIESVHMTTSGPAISWTGISGKVYRVAYKNNLMDSTWIPLGSAITASNGINSWIDTNTPSVNQRFYVIMQTD